ncbi:MAG: oligosaccharide flippase family protein [Deltaproteobacteria bacterium]|nr:oligosaccharide flippase family protein [Deltaproteobacteria bacterium]MCW5807713.1 oligosaccharide flippase family protein [Deltaproteobacteria bacterium]
MKASVSRGLAWIGLASTLVALLDLAALLIINNIWISPGEYGLATAVAWLFPILDQATDLGLSAAVIQRDDHDDTKISTVFWMNVAMGVALFGLMAAIAPLVARPIVAAMAIVYGTKLIWQNVYFIPVALMKRELRYKELSVVRIVANVGEFAGKIGFAWAGFGVWCFVLGPLARVLITGIGVQICHPWRPKMLFKLAAAKDYLMFGIKTSGSQILFYFYTNIHFPIVGHFFGDHALGLYRMATEIVLEPVRIISNVVVDIAFPTFARLRHSRERLIEQLVSFTNLNLITVMSYSIVVFVAADQVVTVLFPDYPCADAIRILGFVAVLRSISLVIPPLLDGIGHPNRTFVYTLTASIALPITFFAGSILLGGGLQALGGWGATSHAVWGLDLMTGYLSAAVAWGIGYPIAFVILIWLAMYSLDWKTMAYFRKVSGVAGCLVAGGVAGAVVHFVLDRAGALDWVILLSTSAAVALATGLLLAYALGMTPASAARAMKGEGEAS